MARKQEGSSTRSTPSRGEVGEYLHRLRRERGLSLRETAERASGGSLSRSYLSQVETGKIRRPSPEILSALVTAYQADYGELLRRAGYSGFETKRGGRRGSGRAAADLEWLPPDTARLDPEERGSVAQYIEYLLWRRQFSEPPEGKGGGRDGTWIPWDEVREWTHELRATLLRNEFDPDLVIGLGRGGAILGGMVAGALGLKPVGVLDMVHDADAPEEERKIEGALNLKGVKKALLVQGEVRSGLSMAKAKEKLLKEAPKLKLRTIALVVYPDVEIDQRPDWYKKMSRLDPPWRQVQGYERTLRQADDD
jgi:hypoxanthine phosphoribosyltransferase